MTVDSLRTVSELVEEMMKGGDRPVAFVYQRTSGQTLFAVFVDSRYVDLMTSPDVVLFCEMMIPPIER